jgi:hypothetical protein
LQIRLDRFDSGARLQTFDAAPPTPLSGLFRFCSTIA